MRQMLRSMACIFLVTGLLLSLAACGGNRTPTTPTQTNATVGESLSTLFFDWTVTHAERVEQYETYTAQGTNTLVLVRVTVTNNTQAAIQMYDSDFTLAWGEAADAFAWMLDAFAPAMQPAQDTLNAGDTRSYDLLFSVPQGKNNLTVCYTEAYQDDKGETTTGSVYRVQLAL